MKNSMRILLLAGILPASAAAAENLQTVAEKSNYQATSHFTEVVDFCQQLAKAAPSVVRLGVLGKSFEGRELPLIILADPPLSTPQEATQSGKLVVFAQANIHAGEVDAKEGYLMLAREIALGSERKLLKDLVVVLAPIFNADGNERFSKKNRPGQVGPAEGMGIRHNAENLDLNRDWVKLESPEDRALVRFLDKWNPAIWIDGHTTNGSFHRYVMTYESPRNAAGNPHIIEYARDKVLPEVSRCLEKLDGYHSFFYGNFSRDRKFWDTVPPTPRYSTHYGGLRNLIGILSESYAYASYKDRCLASRDFARCIFEYAAEHKDEIRKLLADAREATTAAGQRLGADDQVVLRQKQEPLDQTINFLGYVEEQKDGKHVSTGKPKEYPLRYRARALPTLSVRRPYAYLFPAEFTKVTENLQRHGIDVKAVREDIELDVEVQRIDKIKRETREARGHRHHTVEVTTTTRTESRRVPAGTILLKTAQPLGTLAAYLLEPQSEDGLCTWNFFDEGMAEGKDFPVLRLMKEVPITSGKVRPLPDDRGTNRTVTFNDVYVAAPPLDFGGDPVSGLEWLPDGEHFLQVKDGRLYKVQAATGGCEPFHDPAKLAQSLAAIASITKQAAEGLAAGARFHMDPQRVGALIERGNDLYYARFDGGKGTRLTTGPGHKELLTFSPDGKYVAFVRDHNLYAVDIATHTERMLTSDGSTQVSNGKPDWVYGEEIYNYHKTYWWSPDSTRIVFLRCDDQPVPTFTIIDNVPPGQNVEPTRYPKAGEHNPDARLGVVAAEGGPVRWIAIPSDPGGILITRAGWTGDGRSVYFYVQDRAQTWLDFYTVPRDGGTPTRLFRETTQAWVDDPGEPHYLKDGSFLLASERTGWKHFYHFDHSGKLLGPVTSGEWEARELLRVDEENGSIYASGTRDSSLASNLYRFRIDGSGGERLTPAAGDHHVTVSPRGSLFVDACSSSTEPTRVWLRGEGGALVRTLDTNPVYAMEEFRLGKYRPVQIKTDDGFTLEASVLTPPDFDPARRYPVWFMTYGGPHFPTIHDSWQGGRVRDQVLTAMGFVVFRCDPRSASGKGVVSTWTAYRKLGVGELKDIETAIGWLIKQPYVDAARIGMSGHSYGGFMTAYALTHSKLFAAGIAGAPVTDWRSYDTIYTERYMNTPAQNPEGYKVTSVVQAADHLHGRLLILHGLFDNNVHAQNSIQFIDALQRANKSFEVMIYPRSRHRLSGVHYQRLMIDFMKRTLGVRG